MSYGDHARVIVFAVVFSGKIPQMDGKQFLQLKAG